MANYTFASIAHPDKYGYRFDTSCWDGGCNTSRKFRFFETYGDGMTQHSNDRSVTWELLTDYLNSLAAAMLTNSELAESAVYYLDDQPNAESLTFAASVVYKDERDYTKARFYSMKLRKIGTRTKANDRRFEEIRSWHDGSRAAMYRLLAEGASSEQFSHYQIWESVRVWADAQKKYIPIGENPPTWTGFDAHSLRYALGLCRDICDATRKMEWAKRAVERLHEDAAPKSDVTSAA